jgi:hypothetical protein
MNEERTRKCLRQEEHILVPGRVSPVKTHKYTQLARQHRINTETAYNYGAPGFTPVLGGVPIARS